MNKDICYESDLLELSPEDIEICYGPFKDIDKTDSFGDTLLLAACKVRNIEYVTHYLQKAANPDFRNDCGDTPLLELIDTAEDYEELSVPIIKVLLEAEADLEVRGYMEKTPFLKACSRKSLAVLKLLVESGCNTRAVIFEYDEELDGNWFADCFNLDSELKKYINNAIKKNA